MKVMACLLVALMVLMAFAPAISAGEGKGGALGFFVGCCFGVRSAAAYNDGKDLHWREWGQLIPVFQIVVSVMDGIDGAQGVTSAELAARFGANFY